jgi:hypothetical protein
VSYVCRVKVLYLFVCISFLVNLQPANASSFLLGEGPAPSLLDASRELFDRILHLEKDGFLPLQGSWGNPKDPEETIFFNTDYYLVGLDPFAGASVDEFLLALSQEKPNIMVLFGIDNQTYNKLAAVAFATLGNESSFYTSFWYRVKKIPGVQDTAKSIVGGHPIASRGPTQIKYLSSKMLRSKRYAEITLDSLDANPRHAAIATICILAEFKQQIDRTSFGKARLLAGSDTTELVRYYYRGQRHEIINGTATPEVNEDIKTLKKNLSALALLNRPAEKILNIYPFLNEFLFQETGTHICIDRSSKSDENKKWSDCPPLGALN